MKAPLMSRCDRFECTSGTMAPDTLGSGLKMLMTRVIESCADASPTSIARFCSSVCCFVIVVPAEAEPEVPDLTSPRAVRRQYDAGSADRVSVLLL